MVSAGRPGVPRPGAESKVVIGERFRLGRAYEPQGRTRRLPQRSWTMMDGTRGYWELAVRRGLSRRRLLASGAVLAAGGAVAAACGSSKSTTGSTSTKSGGPAGGSDAAAAIIGKEAN